MKQIAVVGLPRRLLVRVCGGYVVAMSVGRMRRGGVVLSALSVAVAPTGLAGCSSGSAPARCRAVGSPVASVGHRGPGQVGSMVTGRSCGAVAGDLHAVA